MKLQVAIAGCLFAVFSGSGLYAQTAGTVDTSFGPIFTGGASGTFCRAVAVQPDGRILIGGDFTAINGQTRTNLAGLLPDGTLLSSAMFGASVPSGGAPNNLVIQPDRKILVCGIFSSVNGQTRRSIARLNADGTLESSSTFNTGSGPDNAVYALALQPDGKIVIAGNFHNVNGQPRNYIARLNPNGSLESTSTFNPGTGADSFIEALMIQPDGKIVIGGNFTTFNGQSRGRIARLLPNGSLEGTATFNPGTGTDGQVNCAVLQTDGKILVGGDFTTVDGRNRGGIVRLLPDGTIEGSTNFLVGTGVIGWVESIGLQTDGKMVVGGAFSTFNGQPRNRIARLLPSGALEPTTAFNAASGRDESVSAIVIQEDGKILVGGHFGTAGQAGGRMVRLNNDPAVETLSAVDRSRVQWSRSGASPEVERMTFEVSLNGTTWTTLGNGVRIAGGWQLTGLALPPKGSVRATGRVPCGANNCSSSLVETVAAFEFPVPDIRMHAGATTLDPQLISGQSIAVSFGTTRQTVPATRSFTLSNAGTAPLQVTSVTLPPEFTTDLPALPATVGIGAALTFQISLTAATTGTFTGNVSVASNDEDQPFFFFPVTGTVVTPEIAVHDGAPAAPELLDGQAAAVDFGRNVQGTPATRSFTIANTGSAGLLVSSITVPAGYTPLKVPSLPLTIGIGQTLTFELSLTTLAAGTYSGNVAIASDDLDEAVFDFSITGAVFIPEPVAAPPAAVSGLINRQTGLREQTVHLANDTTATVPAYNVIIRGLPAGVEVNNASSQREDGSWVVYVRQSMNPNTAQDLLLEYFSPDRLPAEFTPQLSTEVVLDPPDLSVPGDDVAFRIDVVKSVPGGVLIEFPTAPGRRYQVQYSGDGSNWQSSLPSIRAAANRTQWVDRGLPRTDSSPTAKTSRFYRVAELAP